ncbi:hypothetical protein GCM10007870_20240 [Gluconobacter kondonii]|uniref:Secreted protein n=1 Tax=Gluconobacter kondonii TaxID=941463 RepID=A0ABQ5WU87_9PROT|nr:hypothetical protein GCM10007870_20240 [Gluconobacter kondonii]
MVVLDRFTRLLPALRTNVPPPVPKLMVVPLSAVMRDVPPEKVPLFVIFTVVPFKAPAIRPLFSDAVPPSTLRTSPLKAEAAVVISEVPPI